MSSLPGSVLSTENKGTRRDFRSYDKPWQVNAKKPKKSKSDLAVSNISPPSPESKSCKKLPYLVKWCRPPGPWHVCSAGGGWEKQTVSS